MTLKNKILPLILLALSACVKETNPISKLAQRQDEPYVNGVVNVLLSQEMADLIESDLAQGKLTTKSMALNQSLDELGIKSISRLFPEAGEFEGRTRREGLHLWYAVEYDSSIPATKASADLGSVDGIELVEPRRRIKPQTNKYYPDAFFNDDYYILQWGLDNRHQKYYTGPDINVYDVWDNFTTGDPDVIVAVIDDGLEITHEDLANNCNSEHYNFVENNSNLTAGMHGTHIAGVISAVNNNEIGICGIAGGDSEAGQKGVRLMGCQIMQTDDDGNTENGDPAQAFKWACDHGALIANCSWGYTFDYDESGDYDEDELADALAATIGKSLKAAVDYFIKYAGCDDSGNQKADSKMKGGLVVFAAGNEGIANGTPANYEPVVAVGAIDTVGLAADFSNYGPWVDIAAPGCMIGSTAKSSYYYMNGTSMATPFVSGVAALVVSYFGGEGFTCDDLKEKIIGGANYDWFEDNTHIGPLLDAMGAMKYGESFENNEAPVSNNQLENMIIYGVGRSESVDLSQYFTDPEGQKMKYKVTLVDDIADAEIDDATLTLTATAKGTTEVRVRASDFLGAYATQSFKLMVRDSGERIIAYPNPCTDSFNLATGPQEMSTNVRVVSQTGTVIYDGIEVVSAFNPLKIDMSSCAPGRYSVKATWEGEEYSITVVKL